MDTMGFEPGPSAPEPDEMPTHHVPSGDAGTDAAQSAEREALNLAAMGSSPTVGVQVTPFIPELALGCHAQCGEARMLWKSPASGRIMLSISLPSRSVNPSPLLNFLSLGVSRAGLSSAPPGFSGSSCGAGPARRGAKTAGAQKMDTLGFEPRAFRMRRDVIPLHHVPSADAGRDALSQHQHGMIRGSHRPKEKNTARGTDAQPDVRRVGGGRARTSPPPTAQHKPASLLAPRIIVILGARRRNSNAGTEPTTILLRPAWLARSRSARRA